MNTQDISFAIRLLCIMGYVSYTYISSYVILGKNMALIIFSVSFKLSVNSNLFASKYADYKFAYSSFSDPVSITSPLLYLNTIKFLLDHNVNHWN